MDFLSFLFPSVCPECGSPVKIKNSLCHECFSRIIFTHNNCRVCGKPLPKNTVKCLTCRESDLFLQICTMAAFDGVIRNMIHRIKFGKKKKEAELLGKLAFCYLKTGRLALKGIDLVLPVPLSKERLNQRGFNQSEIIASEICSAAGLTLSEPGTVIKKDILPQSGLSKDKRKENIRDSFCVMKREYFRNKNLLIIDDVITTGSTLQELGKTLKSEGSGELYAFGIAHGL